MVTEEQIQKISYCFSEQWHYHEISMETAKELEAEGLVKFVDGGTAKRFQEDFRVYNRLYNDDSHKTSALKQLSEQHNSLLRRIFCPWWIYDKEQESIGNMQAEISSLEEKKSKLESKISKDYDHLIGEFRKVNQDGRYSTGFYAFLIFSSRPALKKIDADNYIYLTLAGENSINGMKNRRLREQREWNTKEDARLKLLRGGPVSEEERWDAYMRGH